MYKRCLHLYTREDDIETLVKDGVLICVDVIEDFTFEEALKLGRDVKNINPGSQIWALISLYSSNENLASLGKNGFMLVHPNDEYYSSTTRAERIKALDKAASKMFSLITRVK